MNNTKYKVAIALAVLNGEQWLEEQLRCLLTQINIDLTLYIRIEPATNDDSYNIVESFMEQYSNIIIVPSEENSGSAAINFINLMKYIDLERYDYLSFADQDDIWLTNKILEAIRCLNKSSSDGYSSNLTAFDEKSSFVVDKCQPQRELDYLFQGASAGCTYVLTTKLALFIKTIITDNYDKLPQRPSHDWLIYAISRSHGFRWVMDPRSFIFYRQHDSNVRGAVKNFSDYLVRLNVSKSGWYKQHILNMMPFLSNSSEELKVLEHLKRSSFLDRILLILNINNFRRRLKERLFLLTILLFNMM